MNDKIYGPDVSRERLVRRLEEVENNSDADNFARSLLLKLIEDVKFGDKV